MGAVYEIVVRGELGTTIARAFEGMRLEQRGGETAIVGHVADQAQLAGLLRRVSELGLDLVSVEQVTRQSERMNALNGDRGSTPRDRDGDTVT